MSFKSWTLAEVAEHNAKVGRKGQPEQPKAPSKAVERERNLHDEILELSKMNGWLVCHGRMDKKSTSEIGFPDFVIFLPQAKCVFLECKAKGGKVSTEQLAKLAQAKRLGHVAEVVDNLDDAKRIIFAEINRP